MDDTTKTSSVQPDDLATLLQRLEDLQTGVRRWGDPGQHLRLAATKTSSLQPDDLATLLQRLEDLQSDVDRLAIALANVIVGCTSIGLRDGGSGDPYVDRCPFCGGDDPRCQNHGQNSQTRGGQS